MVKFSFRHAMRGPISKILSDCKREIEIMMGRTTLRSHETVEEGLRFHYPSKEVGEKFASNNVWGKITIRFLDGHTVEVKVNDLRFKTNYKEMGFENQKTLLPNQQWKFLELLARNHGELSWETFRDVKPQTGHKIRRELPSEPLKQRICAQSLYKKRKQKLSQGLKAYFKIDEDPLLLYRRDKSYKIRINLAPY